MDKKIIPHTLLIFVFVFSFKNAYSFSFTREFPQIYPFVPMDKKEIYKDIRRFTEDPAFIKNFLTILNQGLSEAKTKHQPWTSSYWPLVKGTIADPYEDSKIPYYADFIKTYKYQWKSTYNSFKDRKKEVLNHIDTLSEEELSKLAPSEKYDLLMGDRNFSLTTRIMKNMYTYGYDNYFYDLAKITVASEDTLELANNYRNWNFFNNSTLEDSLRNDNVISARLESRMAVKLLDAGVYQSAEEALLAVTPTALKEAENYVLADKKVTDIAAWEGICNGWATAAGIIPRPSSSVSFKLPSGKNLIFYPSDIKGLISLYWFNSFIQNDSVMDENDNVVQGGVISVGYRCNLRHIRTDSFGRLYDNKPDPKENDNRPRCVGVHPAKWHLALVNMIGKQGRSFIVERKVKDPVDNHPMYKYKMNYYNPNTGVKADANNVMKSIVHINENDQFLKYRNPEAKYVIGVKAQMTYLDYAKPVRKNTDSASDDLTVDKSYMYDLELDENYNIIGGQWRAVKFGAPKPQTDYDYNPLRHRKNYNQPDFFWTVSKNWKATKYFDNEKTNTDWVDKTKAPPENWLQDYSEQYVGFEKLSSTYFGNGEQCRVKHKTSGEIITVWCEYKTNTPQPLSNIVNTLIERSSGVNFENF